MSKEPKASTTDDANVLWDKAARADLSPSEQREFYEWFEDRGHTIAEQDEQIVGLNKALAEAKAENEQLWQENAEQTKEIEKLTAWVNDLQSGMYINCVYCGHRYGPKENTPVSMAEILKQHIEKCPKHPMSALKARITELETLVGQLGVVLETHGITDSAAEAAKALNPQQETPQ